MPQFIFYGSLELNGVCFFVDAADEKEAKEKATLGQFTEYETSGAEAVNCEMYLKTIELNE